MKKYGHIISLGYNCEVSFQFFLKYHFVESSLFAWVNCQDCSHMIEALKNLDRLTSKGFKADGFMYCDLATGIAFHAKEDKGESDKEKQQELKSRILHLKEKFLKTASDGKENLYIFKYPSREKNEQKVQQDILTLYRTLTQKVKNDFDLLIIFEKAAYPSLHINHAHIYIERVGYFTPDNAVTAPPYDQKAWGKIFSKYRPNFTLPHLKAFKFEEADNESKDSSHQLPPKKYDLVFSMGAACSCASLLIGSDLRRFSAPFDWLWGSDFLGRIKLLVSGFDRFLEKEDLEFCHYNNGDKKHLCDVYYNKYTQLTLNHDFPAGVALEASYPQVKEKYRRRIERLQEKLENASSVLMVFLSLPTASTHPTDNQIIQGWQEVQKKYPNKKIDLLYFVNNETLESRAYKKFSLSPHVMKIVSNYKYQAAGVPKESVDLLFLMRLMSGYELNLSLKDKIKINFIRGGIKLIPFKFLRKKLRRRYHV